MTRLLIAVVLLILGGYGAVEAYPLLAGPSLSLASPSVHAVVSDGIVTVSGTAKRTTALTLNDVPVLPEQDGSFSSTLTLPHGGAILTLKASDRFGRTVTKTRTVFVP